MRAIAATIVLLMLAACGGSDDNVCVELAMKECACCDASQIESCKQAARDANDRNPPPEQGIKLCEAALDMFKSCSDLSPQQLQPICDGTAFQ